MFTALGVAVWPTLFMAVMLDVMNGLTLSIVYGLKRKVDFRYGLIFGLPTAAIAVTIALVLNDFINNNTDALESAAAFVPLIIGIQFGVRAILTYRRRRQLAAQQQQRQEQAASGGGVPPAPKGLEDGEGYGVRAYRPGKGSTQSSLRGN